MVSSRIEKRRAIRTLIVCLHRLLNKEDVVKASPGLRNHKTTVGGWAGLILSISVFDDERLGCERPDLVAAAAYYAAMSSIDTVKILPWVSSCKATQHAS